MDPLIAWLYVLDTEHGSARPSGARRFQGGIGFTRSLAVRPLYARLLGVTTTPEETLQHVDLIGEGPDGARLFVFEVPATYELAGHWVAVCSPKGNGGQLVATDALRLSVFDDEANTARWVHADDPNRMDLLEFARWLGLAYRAKDIATQRLAAEHIDEGWVHLDLGRMLLAEGQFVEALASFERHASEASDRNVVDRARALLGAGRAEEALSVLDEVAPDAYTSRSRAAWVRGLACCALGRATEGVAELRRALDAEDRSGWDAGARGDGLPAAVPVSLANEAFRAGLFEDAIVGCAQLHDRASRMLHGRCLEQLGRWAEARTQYVTARDLGAPDAVEALLALEKRLAVLPAKEAPRATTSIDIGARVVHAKLGTGEVVDMEDGNTPRLLVTFESGVEKWIPLASAKRA